MTVPKGMRSESVFEVYDHAVKMRTKITEWLLRDFGIKEHCRDLEFIGKKYKIDDADKKTIAELLDKYHLGDRVTETFAGWWIEERRRTVDKILSDMMRHISMDNLYNHLFVDN